MLLQKQVSGKGSAVHAGVPCMQKFQYSSLVLGFKSGIWRVFPKALLPIFTNLLS